MPQPAPNPQVDGPQPSKSRTFAAHQPRNRQIAVLAERQHGVISLAQLEALGLSSSAVRSRVAGGSIHRIHEGVFAVGHSLLGGDGWRMSAVLACGPEAVLSHRSAAALWGLRADARTRVDVTAPGRRGRVPRGIDAHRHGSLHPTDRTSRRGIPCTTVARTLLDLAAVVTTSDLRRAVMQAEIERVFDLIATRQVLARSGRRRGVARLRAIVLAREPVDDRTRNRLEAKLLAMCGRAGLPAPLVNSPLYLPGGAIEPDFLWRDARLVVETDGREVHGTAGAFESDRLRDQRLALAGYEVLRFSWRQVADEPERVFQTIRLIHARQATLASSGHKAS